jgi:hypothetical protein
MAEQEVVNSPAAPVDSPSVSSRSSADILSMINQPAQPSVNPNNVAGSKPEDVKPVDQTKPATTPFDELDKVPDKFKNPDGTLDVKRLLGSYLEAEKGLSKLSNVSHETKQAQTELEMYKQLAQDFKSQLDLAKQQPPVGAQNPNALEPEYTEEEIKLIQNNPREWMKQELEKTLQQRDQKQGEESRAQRLKDYEMLTAINKARESLPGFRDVEPEINQMVDQEWVGDDPRAIETLYHAAIGKKTEALVNYASQKAYKEGYEKAKIDLKMQVDGGGQDSAPIDTSVNLESVRDLSSAELKKVLPRSSID